MIEITSRDAKLAAFKHFRVAAPMVEPQAGCIYRITPKGTNGRKSKRQNGFMKAWNAARAAEEIWPGAKEGVDYTLYEHDGLHGFIPFGGKPQPSMKDTPVVAAVEVTPAQRRDAYNELSSVIDGATGRYTGGWTDASVGEATGLPEALIAEVRVQFYGEPKPDLTPEAIDTLKGLKAEVDTIVGAHRKLADVAEGLSARIENALRGI